jgi:hypothetical protein
MLDIWQILSRWAQDACELRVDWAGVRAVLIVCRCCVGWHSDNLFARSDSFVVCRAAAATFLTPSSRKLLQSSERTARHSAGARSRSFRRWGLHLDRFCAPAKISA